jgi:hypothetical protein
MTSRESSSRHDVEIDLSAPHPAAKRRPWKTPRVIVAKAESTANYSALPDDGPFSVS